MRNLDPYVQMTRNRTTESVPIIMTNDEREQRLQTVPVGHQTREDEPDHGSRIRGRVQQAVALSPLVGPVTSATNALYAGPDRERELGGDEERAGDHVARSEDDGEEQREREGLADEQEWFASSGPV